MSEESKDLYLMSGRGSRRPLGAKEQPGRRVVSPRTKTVMQYAAYASVPPQARRVSAPHDG
jgi:hypothetical protein